VRKRTFWIVFLGLLVVDQITKWLAVMYLQEGEGIPVIPGIFDLTLVYNPGAAFGIFSTWPDGVRRASLAVVSIIALLVVFRFMRKEAKNDTISQMALCGILSGACGNIIDRARLDRVIDFLDFYYQEYHWPAFNVADSAISIGVTVLLFRLVFFSSKKVVEQNNKVES